MPIFTRRVSCVYFPFLARLHLRVCRYTVKQRNRLQCANFRTRERPPPGGKAAEVQQPPEKSVWVNARLPIYVKSGQNSGLICLFYMTEMVKIITIMQILVKNKMRERDNDTSKNGSVIRFSCQPRDKRGKYDNDTLFSSPLYIEKFFSNSY